MHANRAIVVGILVTLGCGSGNRRRRPEPTPTQPSCSCAQLDGPIDVPRHAAVRERWESATIEIEAMFAALVTIFADGRCPATIDADVTRVLTAHDHAIRESKALNAMSCDHFGKWQLQRGQHQLGDDMQAITEVTRRCSNVSPEIVQQLGELTILRTCSSRSSAIRPSDPPSGTRGP